MAAPQAALLALMWRVASASGLPSCKPRRCTRTLRGVLNARTGFIFSGLLLQRRLSLEGIQHLLQIDNWITRQRGYRDGALWGMVMVGKGRKMWKMWGVVPAP